MARETFLLPDAGEGLTEAEILRWCVQVGQQVEVNEVLVEIETAKAVVELPSPYAGTVAELLVAEGALVPVGTPIIAIETSAAGEPVMPGAAAPGASAAAGDAEPTATVQVGTLESPREPVLVGYGVSHGATTRRARRQPQGPSEDANGSVAARAGAGSAPLVRTSPPVRRLAKDLGVDLASVTPTGQRSGGLVVTREDVLRHQAHGAHATAASASPRAARSLPPQSSISADVRAGDVLPVRSVRRGMADAMVSSAFTAPHVTEWVEVDVTRTVELVARLRERSGRRISPMLFAAAALVRAAVAHPIINASWVPRDSGDEITVHADVHLGIAVASPRGLIVPVVSRAQTMSVMDLADALSGVIERARDGSTPPTEMLGGTITLTNVGVFGIDGGTPILVPGQAAILAIGQVRRMPWVVVDRDGAEQIAIRDVMTLALSFDHRIVDGEAGSRALRAMADYLEDPGAAELLG